MSNAFVDKLKKDYNYKRNEANFQSGAEAMELLKINKCNYEIGRASCRERV